MADLAQGATAPATPLRPATAISGPVVTVLGTLPGGNKLVRAEFGERVQLSLSQRTIGALGKLGITVNDEPGKYIF